MIHAQMAPEVPALRPAWRARIWRIVALVAVVHVLVGVIGILFFTTMGLASSGVGSCGRG